MPTRPPVPRVSGMGLDFALVRPVPGLGPIFSSDSLKREHLKKQDHFYSHAKTFHTHTQNKFLSRKSISVTPSASSSTPQVAPGAPESLRSHPTGLLMISKLELDK